MTFHDLKDIVMIYSSTPEGKPDYSWDKAKIKVWDPGVQKEMNLIFTGSQRDDGMNPVEINFNATYVDDKSTPIQDAFDVFIHKAFPRISDELAKEYHTLFLNELISKR